MRFGGHFGQYIVTLFLLALTVGAALSKANNWRTKYLLEYGSVHTIRVRATNESGLGDFREAKTGLTGMITGTRGWHGRFGAGFPVSEELKAVDGSTKNGGSGAAKENKRSYDWLRELF